MGTIRCSFCGSEEDVTDDSAVGSVETMSPETAMCRSCSDALKKKSQETKKTYEWSDRDA